METAAVKFLSDHDIEGYLQLLWGTLSSSGWVELVPLQLVTFREMNLAVSSSDREVWRYAQANRLILITNNRNMKEQDALERVIRQENRPDSLPILTVASVDRLADLDYREQCVDKLVEISLELENHLGRGRIYIP